MPVQACRSNHKPGYQYGETGRCYTYTPGNEASRKRAKRKAYLQGAAIEARRGGKVKEIKDEMADDVDVREFDDSINDWMEKLRAIFDEQFPTDTFRNEAGAYEYAWITDFFENYVVVRLGGKYYEVGFEEDGDSVTFEDRDSWQAVKLSYVAEMLEGNFRDVMMITEFRGKYPDVPIADGVDYEELTKGDPNPVFVTLPIGLVNATSGNNNFYDEAFIQEMERQVLEKKPIGLMGHLRPDQRATDFPTEAVHWVGALRVNEYLWGKGYIPAGEPRNRLQRYKATSKKIATSIDASAERIWDASLGAYRMKADTLELAQIDIAPADRAGIRDLAAIPYFTTEMAATRFPPRKSEEQDMDKEDVVKSLTAEDAALLPSDVKKALLAEMQASIKKELGLSEDDDIVASVREMRQSIQEQEQKAVSNRIQELVEDPENGIQLESVRGLVQELVNSRKPKTVKEAEEIYAEVSKSEAVTKALAGMVQEMMGPSQRVPVSSKVKKGPKAGKYFVFPGTDKEKS